MTPTRYPILLGSIAALLALGAIMAFVGSGELLTLIDEKWPNGSVTGQVELADYARLNQLSNGLAVLVGPAVLAALIPGIAALVLLVVSSPGRAP